MNAYFLIRESVVLAHAVTAAFQRKDLPELTGWITGSADMRYGLLDDREFELAKAYPGAIVLSSQLHAGKEVAIAFGPRQEWPEDFSSFRDFHAEIDERMEERKNITEEKWLTWDARPRDPANFVLPRASERKIRLFSVACCDLVTTKMIDARSRRAMEVALRHADGTATDEELSTASHDAREAATAIMRARGREGPDQASPEYGAAALAFNTTGRLGESGLRQSVGSGALSHFGVACAGLLGRRSRAGIRFIVDLSRMNHRWRR